MMLQFSGGYENMMNIKLHKIEYNIFHKNVYK